MKVLSSLFLCLWAAAFLARANAWPLIYPTGVTVHDPDRAFDGYTLFLAMNTDQVFLIDNNKYLCQNCGNLKIELTSGRELQIDHLEIEDETD